MIVLAHGAPGGGGVECGRCDCFELAMLTDV